jgi:hypothetical protein
MNKPFNVKGVRIGTRMPPLLLDRLAGVCAASGIAECAVISAGVEQYLDGTSESSLMLRCLASVAAEMAAGPAAASDVHHDGAQERARNTVGDFDENGGEDHCAAVCHHEARRDPWRAGISLRARSYRA